MMEGSRNVHDGIRGVHRGIGGMLLTVFLKKCLPVSRLYQRAVGFFASSVFGVADLEFAAFFASGGRMELVCSPSLSAADIAAFAEGIYNSRRWANSKSEDIQKLPRESLGRGLLSWAMATGSLSVQIAVVPGSGSRSIYHEKIGVFVTRNDEIIAFEGSANESSSGYVNNYERVLAHHQASGGRPEAAVEVIRQNFEQLWNNKTPGLEIVPLHEAFRRRLLTVREENDPRRQKQATDDALTMIIPSEIICKPPRLVLRPYQKAAIQSWFDHGGMGIYAMATGSGKTVTALCSLEAVFQKVGPPLGIIIVAPYLNLVDQWSEEAAKFGLAPINCSGSRSDWVRAVDSAVFLANASKQPLFSLVTTNATFAGEPFQEALSKIRVRTVLVADEVHNLGARHLQRCLPKRVKLRLGLSATPERWMDEDGTEAIAKYFGDVVFRFDLADALHADPPVLSPYAYHPVLVQLEPDEIEEYVEITRILARYIDSPRAEDLSDVVLALLLKRARLVACARGKIPALANVIRPFRDTRFNLIYCGDGRTEIESFAVRAAAEVQESPVFRQVDAVARLLGTEFQMNVATYTAETTKELRSSLIEEFEQGRKQALVAIRCLDEGVDIPQVRRAFILASSSNPRQFIQRRGRVLRCAEGKDRADIFDFVVVPPIDHVNPGTPTFRVLRNLVTKEMARITEFARLAINGPKAYSQLLPILEPLKLMHL